MSSENLCACGKEHISVTKTMLIKKNVAPNMFEFIKQTFGTNAKCCIICDQNTYKAAENIITKLADLCDTVKFDIKSHHADEFMMEDCEKYIDGRNFDCFIAVGSGTVHDITRVAAHKRNAPFISCPTAPSVDGFISNVAPITTKSGMKITWPSSAPIALFADIDVVANAPKRLAASGVGDILGKYISLADWRIAHLLTGEYICEETVKFEYRAVNKVKDSLIDFAENNGRGNYENFCSDLLDALVISGICMQYINNSRPASGAEHHIAHFFEMGILNRSDYFHGENVGIGTIFCTEAYHRFAQSENIKFMENYDTEYDLVKKYYKNIYEDIIKENTPNNIANITSEKFYANLSEIKNIIAEIPSKDEFINLLNIIGGLTDFDCDKSLTLKLAPYIRNRFTMLKLMRCIEI